ncbi:transglutaminase family protein [Oscillatoria sp. FACHB-1406]|uniref:transglutaminase-like domain-containing protein n=1 Tax=Oscillatoria sp. FACHB-1406 TaxID=2692846 RepID=UPI0016877240|nr:transglutaminase family protein [Oscillatoria sp. FACHB-1406]MBD2579892.1 transglutaminase family protein [Oscillatoria sp. FACHB-1406]
MQSSKKHRLEVSSKLSYNLPTECTFIFNISVVRNEHQIVLEEDLNFDPAIASEEYIAADTGTRYLRLIAPPGEFKISYRALVDVCYLEEDPNAIAEIPPGKLPLETMQYLWPSRYCQSDRLFRLAQEEFGHLLPGYSKVTAICNWIYDNVVYLSGSTDSQTSACDTLLERAGVCRDFAHLGIALCRAFNIPARFAAGYSYNLQPPDFHAYFEAYLGDRWYIFDPTRLAPRAGFVRIGTGRDAADASFATIFGPAQMTMMKLAVDSVGESPPERTERAISQMEVISG